MGVLKGGTSISDFEVYHKGNLLTGTQTKEGLLSITDKIKLDGLNKIEKSLTNGNIKINGTETSIYTHPANHDDRYFTETELTGTGGASKIGLTSISGITGTNIQTVLQNMKTYIDNNSSSMTAGTGISISNNVVSLATTGISASTYKSVTVDAYGRITGGTNPTTLAGYGITDAALNTHNHDNSYLKTSGDTATGLMTFPKVSIYKSLAPSPETPNIISGDSCFAIGVSNEISGKNSFSQGDSNLAIGDNSHAEGNRTEANGNNSHTEGSTTKANAENTHAEGSSTTASGSSSHAEGSSTTASGYASHAEGSSTTASETTAHAEGSGSVASGYASHAEGSYTKATGHYSNSKGQSTTAGTYCAQAMGKMNKAMNGSASSYSGTADAFVIGNGASYSALANAFRVTFDGKTYGLSAFNSTGADYAEFFEWQDGNTGNEDRTGYFVTLDGDKIRIAKSTDNYILGIVSATPSVIGDSYNDDWAEKYVTDKWGNIQYKEIIVSAVIEDGIILVPEHTDKVPIINEKWDSSKEYIPREKRPEWSPIGMMGKLLVLDDGTCQINGFCKPNDEGKATSSTEGFRVMKRITEDIIQVFIK